MRFRLACGDAGFTVTGEAATVDALLPRLADAPTDMVVLDLSLGDGSTVTANVKRLQDAGRSA